MRQETPLTLDEIMVSSAGRETLASVLTGYSTPRLLFTGPYGVGKFQAASLVVNTLLDAPNPVDVIVTVAGAPVAEHPNMKGLVKSLARVPMGGDRHRAAIIKHVEDLPLAELRTLRSAVDTHDDALPIMLTAQHETDVHNSLRSVFRVVHMDLPSSSMLMARLDDVLLKLGIQLSAEDKHSLIAKSGRNPRQLFHHALGELLQRIKPRLLIPPSLPSAPLKPLTLTHE